MEKNFETITKIILVIKIIKINVKLEIFVAIQVSAEGQHIVPKEIREVFHNGSKYDYYFIIREPAEELEGQFECLGEKKRKCMTFSVLIKKEIKKRIKIKKKLEKP